MSNLAAGAATCRQDVRLGSCGWTEATGGLHGDGTPLRLSATCVFTCACLNALVGCLQDTIKYVLVLMEAVLVQWERAIYRGRELKAEATLEAAGLTDKATITTVRKVLVPEGWKVCRH